MICYPYLRNIFLHIRLPNKTLCSHENNIPLTHSTSLQPGPQTALWVLREDSVDLALGGAGEAAAVSSGATRERQATGEGAPGLCWEDLRARAQASPIPCWLSHFYFPTFTLLPHFPSHPHLVAGAVFIPPTHTWCLVLFSSGLRQAFVPCSLVPRMSPCSSLPLHSLENGSAAINLCQPCYPLPWWRGDGPCDLSAMFLPHLVLSSPELRVVGTSSYWLTEPIVKY